MASETVEQRRLRRFALAAVITNVVIVITGATVRVTGSGLGCPTWPRCDEGSFVPVPGGEHTNWQMAIEFGNRLLTFPVLAAAVAVVVWLYLTRPHPPELVRFAWVLPIGVVAQALVGGVTVLTGLSPYTVMAHFLLSMVLIFAAVVVHEMARPGRRQQPAVGGAVRHLTTAVVAVAAVVLVLGTVTTGAGPHGGDATAPRLDIDIRFAAIAHADAVWLVLGLTIALVVVTWRIPGRLRTAARVLLGVELVQGAIGYTQYVQGVPEPLVILHVAGSVAFWAAVSAAWIRARPWLGDPGRDRAEAAADPAAGSTDAVAEGSTDAVAEGSTDEVAAGSTDEVSTPR